MARRSLGRDRADDRHRTGVPALVPVLALFLGALVPASGVPPALSQTTASAVVPATGGLKEPGAEFVPRQILVRFRGRTPRDRILAAHALSGARVMQGFAIVPNLHVVGLPAGTSVADAIELYERDPNVLYAEPNVLWRIPVRPTRDAGTPLAPAASSPDDPAFPTMWNLHNTGQTGGKLDADIDAPEAWRITTGDQDVVVAVVDTGVDYRHEDLRANLWRNVPECTGRPRTDDDDNGYVDDCFGIDTANGDTDPLDDHDHGTHLTGIIGARGDNGVGVVGVNWKVRVMTCKFLSAGGSGTTSGALECLQYIKRMSRRGDDVVAINASWGSGVFSQALLEAILSLQRAGILVFAAAGSDGTDNDVFPVFPAAHFAPNVVAVTATTHTDELPPFSNLGPHTVHVAAPGRSILSTIRDDDYATLDGTSIAVPHVTGLAALLKAQDPRRDWVAIRNLILAGGDAKRPLHDALISGRRVNTRGSLTCDKGPLFALLRPVPPVGGGGPVGVAALNIDCADPAGPLSFTTEGDGRAIRLKDRGSGPDLAADDGIYSGTWRPALCDVGRVRLDFSNGASAAVQVGGSAGTYRCSPRLFAWRTVAGANLALSDEGEASIASPFPVSFGGGRFTTLTVDANGAVSFHEPSVGPLNGPLPARAFPTLVSPFWDDLFPVPGTEDNVFWEVLGSEPKRELVIEWRNVRHFLCQTDPSATVSFQVVFFEGSRDVLFNYQDVSFGGACAPEDRGASATVGMQVAGTDATQIGLNSPVLADQMAILWSWPCSVTGTEKGDALTGTTGDDVICGLGGADRLAAGAGNDELLGGPGDDRLQGGTGDDVLAGGPGDDRLDGGRGNDLCRGGSGQDVVLGCEGRRRR